jgi:hypothetical protein
LRIQEISIGSNTGSIDKTNYVSIESYSGLRNAKPQLLLDSSVAATNDNIIFSDRSSRSARANIVVKIGGGQIASSIPTTTVTYHIPLADTDSSKLVTDSVGSVSGTFYLPDPKTEGAPKFETGIRQFRLESVTANTAKLPETQATAEYSATGVLTKTQDTVTRTRTGSLVTENKTSSSSVTRSSSTQTLVSRTSVRVTDPLAQSFYLPNEGGEFITKIDVFFYSKDDSIPVTLQLREMANGLPSTTLVPVLPEKYNPITFPANEA